MGGRITSSQSIDQPIPPIDERETERRIPVVAAPVHTVLVAVAHDALIATLAAGADLEEPNFTAATRAIGRLMNCSEKLLYTNQWFRNLEKIGQRIK